jgi:hypothetical protein
MKRDKSPTYRLGVFDPCEPGSEPEPLEATYPDTRAAHKRMRRDIQQFYQLLPSGSALCVAAFPLDAFARRESA